MRTLLVFLALLLLAPEQARPETITFTCRYDSFSNEKGLARTQEDFKLVFVVDTVKETAQVITANGPHSVEALPAPNGGRTFIEAVDGGKVLTTSIDQRGKSVHSRNIILEGRISPSQYYGTCSK